MRSFLSHNRLHHLHSQQLQGAQVTLISAGKRPGHATSVKRWGIFRKTAQKSRNERKW